MVAADAPLGLLLLVGAGGLLALSGVPELLAGRGAAWGPRITTVLVVIASLLGTIGGAIALGSSSGDVTFPSPVPGLRAGLGVDALTGFFALPIFFVGGLGALYGTAYWSPQRHRRSGPRLRFCYGLLLSSLAFVTLARDFVVFLVAWEVMTLATFFLVTTDDEDPAARRAGWLYLLYSHGAILCLFALLVLHLQVSGTFAFTAIPATAPAALRTAMFGLALLAFGTKAGVMPLHSWLPGAHAAAPSHVSAVLSGVVIKMGIYALVRTCGLFAAPPLAWGAALLALGGVAAFFGVVFALGQHDLKRLLAYHSIENIGIILLGLGLAMVGRSLHEPAWVVLGLGGCLLHVWNHALFKSLLFLGAGSVVHATGSRDLESAGGLAKRMPWTAGLFLLASIAICGLPPLNGFVSELLVYLGLVRTAVAPGVAWIGFLAAVLAATGGLALACFVKVFGIAFLGTPRSAEAARAQEAPRSMLLPMATLALACTAIGLAPGLVAPALGRAIAAWAPPLSAGQSLQALAPFAWISAAAAALLALITLLGAALVPVCRRARRRQPALPTWDCGYAATSPRLQYTASSFAALITSRFAWVLRPEVHRPRITGLFPGPTQFHTTAEDPILATLVPASQRALRFAAWMRGLPRGQLQRYILYILAVLVALLAWAIAGGGSP